METRPSAGLHADPYSYHEIDQAMVSYPGLALINQTPACIRLRLRLEQINKACILAVDDCDTSRRVLLNFMCMCWLYIRGSVPSLYMCLYVI